AEPTPTALAAFRDLISPVVPYTPLLPVFAAPADEPIVVFTVGDALLDAVGHMRTKDYSQVVVRAPSGGLTLLTVEGVARWFERAVVSDYAELAKVAI